MIRPELQDMTVSDWVAAKTEMNRGAFNQLVKVARVGGIQVPGIVSTYRNPRITFVSESDVAMYQRARDIEALDKFNSAVEEWGINVGFELKQAVNNLFRHRDSKYVTEKFPRLSDSIQLNLHFDKQYKLETRSIGFSFERHGVYLHQGAGTGYGGLVGSKWTDAYNRTKQTNPKSLGLQGTGSRVAVHWFNDVIRKNLPKLTDILAEYSLDIALNINSIFLPE